MNNCIAALNYHARDLFTALGTLERVNELELIRGYLTFASGSRVRFDKLIIEYILITDIIY